MDVERPQRIGVQHLRGACFVLYVTPTASIPFIQTLHTYMHPWQVYWGKGQFIYIVSPYRYVNIQSVFEPRREISNNVVCATSKASDQPVHMRSLISRLHII